MSHRTLIVARMDPAHADAVAKIFAESDAGPLPHALGVTGRSLFSFHGLYFHLVEADNPIGPALARVREKRDFVDVNTELAAHISPFDPQTWRAPADAMAHQFYRWTPGRS
jgi:Polyketide synthesis cyclase.